MSIFDAMQGAEKQDKKRTTCPYKYTWIDRTIENYLKSRPIEPRYQSTIYCSSIGRDLCPRAFVLNYWRPDTTFNNFNKQLYTEIGKVIHNSIQNDLLGPTGVLRGDWTHPDGDEMENCYSPGPDWKFKEQGVFHEGYRFAGRLDGIISIDRLKAAQVKDLDWSKLVLPEPTNEVHLEIKSIGDKGYKELKGPEDISFAYRLQATIYQVILGREETLFWFVNRDNLNGKLVLYRGEPYLWKLATDFAKTVWTAIKNKTLPEPLNPLTEPDPWATIQFKPWVEAHESVKNDWPYLGNAITF